MRLHAKRYKFAVMAKRKCHHHHRAVAMGFVEPAGALVSCRLADGNLERICRLFSTEEFIALRVEARGDGPFVL